MICPAFSSSDLLGISNLNFTVFIASICRPQRHKNLVTQGILKIFAENGLLMTMSCRFFQSNCWI